MTSTYLTLLFHDSYISTTFTYVARYGGMTRWHPVSSGREMSFMPLISSSLLPFRQLGPAASLTARWATLVSFVFLACAAPLPARLSRAPGSPPAHLLQDPRRAGWARARCCSATGQRLLRPAGAPVPLGLPRPPCRPCRCSPRHAVKRRPAALPPAGISSTTPWSPPPDPPD